MAEPFHALGIYDIQRLNKECIERFGGFFSSEDENFHNRASLEYVLESILFPVFGVDRHPTCLEKIAAIVQQIVCNHIFHDGNKRTGLAVCIALLDMNNFSLVPTNEDEDFVVRIAEERLSVEAVTDWLKRQARAKPIF